MIHKLVARYSQKSSMLLYPLLQIRRRGSINPIGTYLRVEGRQVKYERSLFVLHPARTDEDFKNFEKFHLTKSPCFRDIIKVGGEAVYVYDMAAMASDYDHFIKGRYSMMSEVAKKRIMNYQREPLREGQEPSSNAAYIQTFLYPRDYHGIYADLLWEDDKTTTHRDPHRSDGMRSMMENCELCEPPDMLREKLVVKNNKIEVLYSLSK
jgi:hypothetical protein